MEHSPEHSLTHSIRWSRAAARWSEIQGSLLFTNAVVLLVGAWATLGVASVPDAASEEPIRRAHPLALEEYDSGCESGDAAACNNLGVSYHRGYGTEPDTDRALELFTRACQMGSAQACNNQGALLDRAWVDGVDAAPMVDAYDRACNGGYALGCSNIGALHAYGKGVTHDEPLARWYFERACQMGSPEGCENLLVLQPPAR